MALLSCKVAVITFGGAYAVLSHIAQQAVESYAWLAPGEMLDGPVGNRPHTVLLQGE